MRWTGSRTRQVAVTASFLICVLGAISGAGLLGLVPVSDAAGGLLSPESTQLAPASPAFSVWSLIYVALGAYTIWQWWDHSDPRALGWPLAASMLLNAVWIVTVQAGLIRVSVLVIAALLAVLVVVFRRCLRARPRSVVEAAVADGAAGLYLGWVIIALSANLAAAVAGSGGEGIARSAIWATAALAVIALAGVAVAVLGRGRLTVAATMAWGLSWIAVARATGEPASTVTAVAAGTAAAVILLATALARVRTELGSPPAAASEDG
ncbi:tryptophan-rich sensory protein [Bogoriella caseilytica]|uniref:TspO/MBR related protein n=1 Tax=Bogoriella caseilytica TaxID=56055 RepID=A0A3N2B9I1_9MICO|nr:tryptophan-rich sensory protein [Bogoriella caseilytica]ROR71792.1 TspO/MBR related protein [Bogoriella caseilytica]